LCWLLEPEACHLLGLALAELVEPLMALLELVQRV